MIEMRGLIDISGGAPGPVLDPDTYIRLTIEDYAGDGWDGQTPGANFSWSRDGHVAVEIIEPPKSDHEPYRIEARRGND